jgi:hypothetical protein
MQKLYYAMQFGTYSAHNFYSPEFASDNCRAVNCEKMLKYAGHPKNLSEPFLRFKLWQGP